MKAITSKKIEKIKNRLFEGKQKNMAQAIRVSGAKISEAIAGKGTLAAPEIGILLTDYHIDAYWLYDGDDSTDVVFSSREVRQAHLPAAMGEQQYQLEELLVRQMTLMEDLAEMTKTVRQENERLKKYTGTDTD